jgi:hypothetical protein
MSLWFPNLCPVGRVLSVSLHFSEMSEPLKHFSLLLAQCIFTSFEFVIVLTRPRVRRSGFDFPTGMILKL